MEHVSKSLKVSAARVTGAAIFVPAFVTYALTVAPTAAGWDCGEFMACSYTLGVPHPPGTPLYIMLGRIVTLLPIAADIGLRLNLLSVLVSALTVLLAFKTILLLIERTGKDATRWPSLFAGVLGALALCFSDSFWFNAVEAEVYAFSSFFTALVFWLGLRWLRLQESAQGERICLLIFYLVGLSLGLHLLTLLVLPSIFILRVMQDNKQTSPRLLGYALAAALIFGTVYFGSVHGIPLLLKNYGVLGLSILALMLVGVLWYAVRNRRPLMLRLVLAAMMVLAGYSTYTMLYIRSGLQPSINENHPDTPEKFASYLNREQYGDIPFDRRAPLWEYQVKKMYIRYFGWQFIGKGDEYGSDGFISETLALHGLWGIPFLIGLLGGFAHFRRDRSGAAAILMLFLMTGVAIAIYLNQENPQPRERDYAYVGSFYAFAIWIGMGAQALLSGMAVRFKCQRRAKLFQCGIAFLLLLLVPARMFAHNYRDHDRTGNYVARDYAYNILQSCEQDAILFTNGDNDTFPMWYLQEVEGIRRDVRVVCLSLLNTPWYIKQLRDQQPRVPIRYSDDEIDRLKATVWPEPKRLQVRASLDSILHFFEKDVSEMPCDIETAKTKPVLDLRLAHSTTISGYPVLLVQDIMAMHILASNDFRRPIYFSVTVAPNNMLGLNEADGSSGRKTYLRMDGLALKVIPFGGDGNFISPKRLEESLYSKFLYRGLSDPEVSIDRGTIGLLQNYRNAFIRLASHWLQAGKPEKALVALDKMATFMPPDIIPYMNYRQHLAVGQMHHRAGRERGLANVLTHILKRNDLATSEQLELASIQLQWLQDRKGGKQTAVNALETASEPGQVLQWLADFYVFTGNYAEGAAFFERRLQSNPQDVWLISVVKQLHQLEAVASRRRQ